MKWKKRSPVDDAIPSDRALFAERGTIVFDFDIIIIGAGPGGIWSAYELRDSGLSVGVFEEGNPLRKRKCPIDGDKVKSCVGCKRAMVA